MVSSGIIAAASDLRHGFAVAARDQRNKTKQTNVSAATRKIPKAMTSSVPSLDFTSKVFITRLLAGWALVFRLGQCTESES
jgi:hypothetical protein